MKTLKYQAKEGAHINDDDANIIGSFIDKRFPDGCLTSNELVLKARPKSSPIHRYFEWDDAIAASEYRLEQARYLIRSIVIEVDEKEPVRAFYNVRLQGESQYMSLNNALNIPDIWDQVIDKAYQELEVWKLKYERYKELSPIITVVKKEETKWQKLKKRKMKQH